MQLAETAGPEDVVLACFTGGSSALACLPADGVSFEEKRELHRLLLGSGAAIREINAVRKHVSGLKGGRLAAAMGGASVVNLTVSDVVGDPLDAITDPTVTDTTTGEQAIAVLHAYDLWDAVAPSIRRHLTATVNDAAPQLDDLSIQSLVLVTGADVANAMVRRSTELGVTAHVRVDHAWRARAARSARRWPRSPSRSTTTAARSPGPACWSAPAARRR